MLAIASIIFLATLVLVIWQPKGLSIGWSAAGGAAIALCLGVFVGCHPDGVECDAHIRCHNFHFINFR